MLAYVFGEEFEEDGVVFVANSASREAYSYGAAVLADPIRKQTVKLPGGAEVVGDNEPLERVGMQGDQVASHQFIRRRIAEKGYQGGVGAEQDSGGVTTANAVGSVGDQRAEIDLRAAQAFLRGPKRGIEGTDQQRHENKQHEMYDGLAILRRGLSSGKREIGTDGEGERGCDQSRFPAAVPGADHDGDREHHQAAFYHIGKCQGGYEGERDTKDGDPVPKDGRTSWRDVAGA